MSTKKHKKPHKSQLGLPFAGDAPQIGEVERHFRDSGLELLVGVDEAGRGPLAGPVSVAAVALPPGHTIDGLDDSKKLTEAARERLFEPIQQQALAWHIELVDAATIDRINILQATFLGMRTCVTAVLERLVALELEAHQVVIDGHQAVPWPDGAPAGLPPQSPIVKGDRRSLNIAAASVLAKVARDRLMVELDAAHPGYGLAGHKGYPTPSHKAAVAELGPSPIHRRSFRGVAEHCEPAPPSSFTPPHREVPP